MAHSQSSPYASDSDGEQMKISANKYVGQGFPPLEGKRLAEALLAEGERIDWNDLEIDVSPLASALLISAFFNGFLQAVYERSAPLLDSARRVQWHVQFPFQRKNVGQWMTNFVPQPAA